MKNIKLSFDSDTVDFAANSRLISDNKEQILNMNKRMKVRRKSQRLPSSSLNWFASRTKITSSTGTTTTTTKTMFISLLTLCHLLGYTLCIGKFSSYLLHFMYMIYARLWCECFLFMQCLSQRSWVHVCLLIRGS